jgi:type I restriction enzyme, S subunit
MRKRYPSYKPSGVEWIGEIPKHWNLYPLRRSISLLTDYEANGSFASVKENVSVGPWKDGSAWFVRATDLENNRIADRNECKWVDENTFKFLQKTRLIGGEILITKRGEIGKVYMLPKIKVPATLAPNLYLIKLFDTLNPAFVCYYLKEGPGKTELMVRNSSTTLGALYKDDCKEILVPVPPLNEQKVISDFLDKKTFQIDETIQKKQRLIELLQEERTALINRAVTQGLDDKVPLRTSRIEWMGEIPEHWELKKLKHLVNKIGSGITPKGGAAVYGTSGIPLLRSQNIYFDGLRLDDVAYITPSVHDSMDNSKVHEGDVLLNITGASIGRCYFVEPWLGEANVNQHVCIIRPTKLVLTKYLYVYLMSFLGQVQIDLSQNGANREGLNFEQLKNFFFPLPPIQEQIGILTYLDKILKRIDNTVNKVQQEKILLKEYRTALINEAVTGKICVV